MKKTTISLGLSLCLLVACRGRDSESHAGAPREQPSTTGETQEHPGHDEHAEHGRHDPIPAQSPSMNTSIFQLESRFTDATGQPFPLSRLSGEPSLVVMFYGTCTTICPVLAEDARAVVEALSPEDRAHMRLVFVTFDPERDTAERMVAFAREHGLDLERTVLLRGATDGDIRELSAVLGVQYRKLPDGNFAHSAVMTLLDREGRIVERVEGLRQDNAPMVARVRAIVGATP